MKVSNGPKQPFHRRLLSLFLTILVAYLLVLAFVRMFESRLIFFPNYPGRLDADWHPRGLNVEDVWLTASDGVKRSEERRVGKEWSEGEDAREAMNKRV